MSPRLPVAKPRDVIRARERAGFFLEHVTGSHHILKHPDRPAIRVTVPMHKRDLKRGTLAAIVKATGLPPDEFIGFL
jgi:predicted RNA binding protein YcfA (HicA-like mRNA interferase family)